MILSFPKNECLDNAAAAKDPKMIAINVERLAILSDSLTAFQISSLPSAIWNHLRVYPGGGNW